MYQSNDKDYRSDGWTDLLEGTLCKMMERISEKRQLYSMEQVGDVVSKVNQTLKDRFQSAAAMEVGQKYMVTER